jgi:transketolase
MNTIHNRRVVCETLIELSEKDRDIVVLCSDSRGSASMAPFAEKFPSQFIETGIAEQNIVGIAAGLAASGKNLMSPHPRAFSQRARRNRLKLMLPTQTRM